MPLSDAYRIVGTLLSIGPEQRVRYRVDRVEPTGRRLEDPVGAPRGTPSDGSKHYIQPGKEIPVEYPRDQTRFLDAGKEYSFTADPTEDPLHRPENADLHMCSTAEPFDAGMCGATPANTTYSEGSPLNISILSKGGVTRLANLTSREAIPCAVNFQRPSLPDLDLEVLARQRGFEHGRRGAEEHVGIEE